MLYDVFISYTKEDQKHADAALAALESKGIRCWIAPRNIAPSKEWGAEIIKGIRDSRAMLVIFSSNANRSNHIRRELTQADEKPMPVITFRVEEVEPEDSLAYYLDTMQWLDAFPKPREKHAQLVETVKRLTSTEPPEPAPPPIIRPELPKWLIAVGGLLLFAAAVIGVWALWPKPVDVAEVNANKTPTPFPSSTPVPSTTIQPTPNPSQTPNTNGNVGPNVTPTAPVDETGQKITQLFAVLDRGDSTDGARRDAIYGLEPLAKKDFGTHMRVVRQLTEFIRKRAPIQEQCSKRPSRRLPEDLQAAIEVLGSRQWWYGNGETELLDLSDTDLSGAYFSKRGAGAHFEGVRFRGTCLDNVLMAGANLRGAYLSGASVSGIDVSDTDLGGADLSQLQCPQRGNIDALLGVAKNLGQHSCAQRR